MRAGRRVRCGCAPSPEFPAAERSVDGLDFVGRLESFNTDFVRVLDHVGASEAVRRDAFVPINVSQHKKWSDYYTKDLADRVYRAFERDFDRFAAAGNAKLKT